MDGVHTPARALTWRAEHSGIHVVDLRPTEASLFVVQGACQGPAVSELVTAIDQPSDRFLFRADRDAEYTFVVQGDAETAIQLSVVLVCAMDDPAYCVRYDDTETALVCGLRVPTESEDVSRCAALDAPGAVDARCPDTTFREVRVEGCCRPSGECGHHDPQLGCHDLAMESWASSPPLVFYCDERAIDDQPPYFECAAGSAPCATALDCCAHSNYGNASCVDGVCVPAED